MNTPNTWDSLDSFYTWYTESGLPYRPPTPAEVFLSDDATAVCLFREGQFQVELYLIHPEPLVQDHEHPGVEVIKVETFDGQLFPTGVLRNGQSHGVGIRDSANKTGYPLLAVQRWHPKLTPTTVASRWKGKTAGPMHEALIKRFNPDAYIVDGYADVTRKI